MAFDNSSILEGVYLLPAHQVHIISGEGNSFFRHLSHLALENCLDLA